MRRGNADRGFFLVGQRPNHACRRADDQAPALEPLAFRDQRARSDQTFWPERRAVQDSCTHANQAVVGDGAAVDDRLVADRDPRSDGQRGSRIGMADRAVLQIRLLTDEDAGSRSSRR